MRKNHTLIIAILLFSSSAFAQLTRNWGTYYGEANIDYASSVVTDASGNVYLFGYTNSTTGISTVGSHQPTYGGGSYDAFLIKFNSAGIRQWGTYYGGTLTEVGAFVTVDGSGNVYLVGYTNSTTGISTIGTHQPTYGGAYDAFLVKFNSAGVRQWGTYYGGTDFDEGRSVTVDASGNVYFVGRTLSITAISTLGSHQPTFGGGNDDAFLAVFNSAGIRQWATYYGGTSNEKFQSVHLNGSGDIYLTGETGSPNAISTVGSFQPAFAGSWDAFLVKFNNGGVRQWGTYYGGTGDDLVFSGAMDGSGNIYFLGSTSSTTGISTVGSHQPTHAGGVFDAFLVQFNSAGIRTWATYYGAAGAEYGNYVTTDALSNVYIAGNTPSTTGISTVGSYQPTYGGGFGDAFLVQFNSAGIRQWGTYYGGTSNDEGYSVSVDASGVIYLAGHTDTNVGTAIATLGSHQPIYGGGMYDAFLVQFICTIPIQPGTISGPVTVCDGATNNYSITAVPGATSYAWVLPGGWTGTSTTTSINATASTTSGNITVTANNTCGSSPVQTLAVTVNNVGVNVISNPVLCNGGNTGDATATPTGTGPFTYLWSNAQTTATATGLVANTYTVTVTGVGGCTATSTVTITQPTILTVSQSNTSNPCFGDCIATSTPSASGGTPAYSYNYVPAGPTNLCPGLYTITVTDANSCFATTTVLITQPTQVSANASASYSSCGTCCDGTASSNPTGGSPGYTYLWMPGGQTTQSVTGLCNGSYTVCVTDANGCSNCSTVNVSFNVGTSTALSMTDVVVYPNPFTDEVTLSGLEQLTKGQENAKIFFLNVLGELVFSGSTSTSDYRLPTSDYPSGVYFIQVKSDDGTVTKKIIKQ